MISQIAHADAIARTASPDDRESLLIAQKARDELSDTTRAFSTSYAFLFLGYKSEFYLWEIVVLARKACLSLIGVAFSTDPRTQVSPNNSLITQHILPLCQPGSPFSSMRSLNNLY